MVATNYRQLAAELKAELEKYHPVQTVQEKVNPQDDKRKRHLALQRKCMARLRSQRPKKTNYRIINAKQLFPVLGEILGIGEAGARCRFYRHQIPANLVQKAKARMVATSQSITA